MTTLVEIRAPRGDAPPWCIDAVPYSYSEAGRVQFGSMPGVRWVRDRRAPNGRGFYRGPAEAIEIAVRTLVEAGVVRIRQSLPPRHLPTQQLSSELPRELHTYQREGVGWLAGMLREQQAALLADEMGLGKSAQALIALRVLGVQRVLIVSPAIVRRHWEVQARRWAPELAVTAVSYEGLVSACRKGVAHDADAIVIDEIHYCANGKAQRTKAVAQWLTEHPTALRVGLSGTPLTTRPRDLWQPLELLWPGRFGRAWEFQQRYCAGHWEEIPHLDRNVWVADGASRIDELAERLKAVMLRRTKVEVQLQLPPRTRVVHEVEIPARARRDLARAQAAINWSDGARLGVSSLLSNIEGYKIDSACELARDVVASGSRALVLTTRKASAEAIAEALNAPCAHGDTAADRRQAALADAPIGVATMYAVTTGIDLVGYDVAIFTGLDWVPSTLLQAEARIHRIGQSRPCTIYYLVGTGTIDEVVRERVIERLDLIATTLGGGDEGEMARELGGGDEDSLIAEIVAAVRGGMA